MGQSPQGRRFVNIPTQSHREAVENGPKGCMKLVFCGTPEFAAPTLEAVIEAGHDVALVVTQPDRAAGRGMEMHAPPVKQVALAHEIPVAQPEKIKNNVFFRALLGD